MNVRPAVTALALGLVLSFSAGAAEMGKEGMGMKGMMDMPMMKEHMSRMQENMKQMKSAKSDKERMRLMQEHMEMTDEHMGMMMKMCGGMKSSMPAGGAPSADPAGAADADHEKHHPAQP